MDPRAGLRRVAVIATLAPAALACNVPARAAAEEPPLAPVASPADAAREDDETLERAEAEKLRRLREEQEAQRLQATRKLNTEQARQTEITRLRSLIMNLEQRESTLQHEVRSLQQQLGTVSREPSDYAALMRHHQLQRELGYSQNQLEYATRSRESAARQLDALRFH